MLRRDRRSHRPVFLVLRSRPGDSGARPLAAPFASPDITVGPDGRPRAVVLNLGSREVVASTEFYSVPAGLPVTAENARLVGTGNPAIIRPGEAVTVSCNEPWLNRQADVLVVMAFHPELDPVARPFDVLADRHVGQMNYAWVGTYAGSLPDGDVRVEIRPAPQGLFRLKLYQEGALYPRCDRIMKPHGHRFHWMEVEGDLRMLFDLAVVDNNRLTLGVGPRGGSPRSGLLTRVTA
ncbi:hypothetical protein [Symbiobacterium thermophilum]|uniref:Uncharacterized protein n=1 Tax=Symbiobacterium thermophilum (strain DSM 24528 / JCM 14929 / IAM 14863 / T) TaxID=292459 RepID=Q67KB5_SYMTH|nr:hypothetical protein [Symbiobacterium thermophilum]BAD41883.1 hypothetical protein STH2900 [Symbiobacterium thermophilum IAM 14863]